MDREVKTSQILIVINLHAPFLYRYNFEILFKIYYCYNYNKNNWRQGSFTSHCEVKNNTSQRLVLLSKLKNMWAGPGQLFFTKSCFSAVPITSQENVKKHDQPFLSLTSP